MESIKSIFVAAAPFGEATAHKFLEKAPHVVFREGKVFQKHYKSYSFSHFIEEIETKIKSFIIILFF